jgi:hypothetical protein
MLPRLPPKFLVSLMRKLRFRLRMLLLLRRRRIESGLKINLIRKKLGDPTVSCTQKPMFPFLLPESHLFTIAKYQAAVIDRI